MILKGLHQQQIEIKIKGFENTDRLNTIYDFLVISLHVQSIKGAWQKDIPALGYDEVLDLIKWMRKTAKNIHPFDSELEFMEPCLAFNAYTKQDGTKRIRIGFGGEFK